MLTPVKERKGSENSFDSFKNENPIDKPREQASQSKTSIKTSNQKSQQKKDFQN